MRVEQHIPSVRVLGPDDLDRVLAVLARDPVLNVFVAGRVHGSRLNQVSLGGELWGFEADGTLESLCYSGANLVPVEATPRAVSAFAERALRHGRRCSSIVGPAEMVLDLWDLLRPHWGPAREVRPDQPVMATADLPSVAPDPLVRRVRPDEIDTLFPASVAMFTEEVGVSPIAGDGGALYRARVAELIGSGRAFARIEHDEVVFKAEIGVVSPDACQVQGVWVRPDRRGHGLAVGGMAAVVGVALREIAPVVQLYVNAHNMPARAAYHRIGMREVGTFASILF